MVRLDSWLDKNIDTLFNNKKLRQIFMQKETKTKNINIILR